MPEKYLWMFFHGAKSCRGLAVGDGERKRSRQAHFVRAVRGFCGSANVSLFFTIFLERPTRQRPLLSSATHLFDVPGGRGGARLRAWRNCQRPISFCFSSRPVAGRIAGMKAHLSRVNAIRLIVLVAAGVFGASAAQGSPPCLPREPRPRNRADRACCRCWSARGGSSPTGTAKLSMLYQPKWNGSSRGRVGSWWIQNSYGTTYSNLPFLRSRCYFPAKLARLWFDQMATANAWERHAFDGWRRTVAYATRRARLDRLQAGRWTDGIHDWGLELRRRDCSSERVPLSPRLRSSPSICRSSSAVPFHRVAPGSHEQFVSRGPAGNLLAPSYAGWRKPRQLRQGYSGG